MRFAHLRRRAQCCPHLSVSVRGCHAVLGDDGARGGPIIAPRHSLDLPNLTALSAAPARPPDACLRPRAATSPPRFSATWWSETLGFTSATTAFNDSPSTAIGGATRDFNVECGGCTADIPRAPGAVPRDEPEGYSSDRRAACARTRATALATRLLSCARSVMTPFQTPAHGAGASDLRRAFPSSADPTVVPSSVSTAGVTLDAGCSVK